MKIKDGFSLRTVGNEQIIIAGSVDFSQIISLNDSAARLWEEIEDTEFNAQKLAAYLTEWYEVDESIALTDAQRLIEEWLNAGIIEE